MDYFIFLCLYKINYDLDIPFLEYYFIKDNEKNTFTFPSIKLDKTISVLDQMKSFFEKFCISNNIICKDDENKIFKCYTKENNNFYAIYEYTSLELQQEPEQIEPPKPEPETIEEIEPEPETIEEIEPTKPEPEYIWAILDEILYKKTILTISIEESILELFRKNKVLSLLKNNENKMIQIPYLLYIIAYINDDYHNVFYNNEHSNNTISLIEPKITDYYNFRNTYLFSTEPLEGQTNIKKIKRYAVFIDDPIYIPDTDLNEIINSNPDFILSEPDRPYNFIVDTKNLWSIKRDDIFIEI
jgi:hypothetical protein